MKNQKNKKDGDLLGLKVLSTLDERLIVGGKKREAGVEHHDHVDGLFRHAHHDHVSKEDTSGSVDRVSDKKSGSVNPLF